MLQRMTEAEPYELLLGRGTYEVFAAHWPYSEGPIADRLNGTRKHIASTTLDRVEWNNSTLITGNGTDHWQAPLRRRHDPCGREAHQQQGLQDRVTINTYERAGEIAGRWRSGADGGGARSGADASRRTSTCARAPARTEDRMSNGRPRNRGGRSRVGAGG
jgi:hypothetical protein